MASKSTPEINGGSMADIAFLMLIFFLMVTTMDSEQGLARLLPPIPEKDQKVEDIKINRRNLIEVKINSKNTVFAGNKYISDVSEIEEIIVEFLTNPANSEDLPERETTMIEGFGEYPVTKGVISLQNDRSTSYDKYIEVQNVLVRAVNKVRDDFSIQNYGKAYAALDADKQKIVRKAVPQTISEAEPKDVKRR